MISPQHFVDELLKCGVSFIAGVPDSLLANFCACLEDNLDPKMHLISANEGNAIATAMGFQMASGKRAAVYMQNSGIGNAVNPLVSLADPDVFGIPLLLIIGWRGEPGNSDEPQHIKQGRITLDQLDTLEIPYWVIDGDTDSKTILNQAYSRMDKNNSSVALVVKQKTFSLYEKKSNQSSVARITREMAIEKIIECSSVGDLIISTTGKASRELYELREQKNQPHSDLLVVGGMGHVSSLAFGVALAQPMKRIICLDGDGSFLMHMGAAAVIAQAKPKNFVHVLLDNGAHESVGGQLTCTPGINFEKLAQALGYSTYADIFDLISLENSIDRLRELGGPSLIHVRIACSSREGLVRPRETPEQNKKAFIHSIYAK
jgi:phosphonopyruvate decarboxylase